MKDTYHFQNTNTKQRENDRQPKAFKGHREKSKGDDSHRKKSRSRKKMQRAGAVSFNDDLDLESELDVVVSASIGGRNKREPDAVVRADDLRKHRHVLLDAGVHRGAAVVVGELKNASQTLLVDHPHRTGRLDVGNGVDHEYAVADRRGRIVPRSGYLEKGCAILVAAVQASQSEKVVARRFGDVAFDL